jgi:flagellin
MAFTINTNLSSLQAQEYLRVTGDFQAKTIGRVTSGLRILNAGDDAAGLAIANGYRSDQAVLTQGIRNANDGLATLQTIDGGIGNISKLLDRARTLAAQSASDTFTGSRTVLNSEFQSVITEIDRQAQAIGLDPSGTFNKSLQVFIGGGREHGSVTEIANGAITVNLTDASVDSKALGLSSFQATGADISAHTTTAIIAANNGTSTKANFNFYGAGFGKTATPVQVSVETNGITDLQSMATAINSAISGYNSTTAEGTAFKNAGITASVSSDGKSLVFSSSKTGFAVDGANNMAAAFLGAFGVGDAGDAAIAAANLDTKGTQESSLTMATGLAKATSETQNLVFSVTDASGVLKTWTVTLAGATAVGANQTAAEAVEQINTQLQNSGIDAMKGIVAYKNGADASSTIKFVSKGNAFTVTVGSATGGHGMTTDGTTQNANVGSAQDGSTVTAEIGTADLAKSAVTKLAEAVKALGVAQAAVGKGQNLLNYAVSLASTQLTNLAASESRIRDADLAAEAANLTKAQILQQAGVAALAQANSAPQAVLSLLRG